MTGPHDHDTTDRGAALLLAIGVLAIVALLGAVALADAGHDLRHADRLVDRAESDGVLDIALADAWDGIVAGRATTFEGSGRTGDHDWTYRAVPAPDGRRWSVSIETTTEAGPLRAGADIAREALLPHSLRVRDVRTGPLTGRVSDRVAILESADFGGRSLGDQQELVDGASCRGCTDAIEVDHVADPPAAPAGLSPWPCPDTDGVITGRLDGDAEYDCRGAASLRIEGAIDSRGTVVVTLGPDTELTIAGADVNPGGDPTAFFLHQPTRNRGRIEVTDSTLVATVLAPETPLSTAGLRWSGAIVVDELRTRDGTELTGSRPASIEALGFGGWRLVGWTTNRDG